MLVFELGAATVTVGAALVAVFATVCVWAAGGDATAIRPDKDVAVATLPLLKESELTDNGFCAAGKIICGYCGKGNIMKTHRINGFSGLQVSKS
jgi:aerobic-type carbon monoxide dehydrogenase small subunit (CoxS/CutS family)